MLRPLLVKASQDSRLRRIAENNTRARRLAMRFVAGETLDDGMAAAHALAAQGKRISLDYVGEHVDNEEAARAAAKVYLEALDRIGQAGLKGGVSVKPTQMGLTLSAGLCAELLDDIATAAAAADAHVTLDMEDHSVTEQTIALVEQLHAAGHTHVGCAVQAHLHRTLADVTRLSARGASLRLCKGAYAEPPYTAYQSRGAVSASYMRCADWLLSHGTYPRFATHDHHLTAAVKTAAAELGRGKDEFEFQMLYGVRPDMQDDLVRDGYRLCVYVPFGEEWYAYFTRRLAERPANLAFFLRALKGGGR